MRTSATYYTIADAPFFPGVVALLNSLRLTGNEGELVVLDRGLHEDQRRLLGEHARLVELPERRDAHPTVCKPFPALFEPHGVAVLIDSDMIVTASLAEIVERARAGKICLFLDPRPHQDRWFAEWEQLLELKAPLRRSTYLNAGFLAVSVERWPELLPRWWKLCARIPPDEVFSSLDRPFWAGDQDVLNALLDSELPADAVNVLPEHGEAYPEELLRVRVGDPRTLACTLDGHPTTILHYSLAPKAWDRSAPLRLRDDAYVRLLPRLLFGEDVRLRLHRRDVPVWLRPNRRARIFVRSLDSAHGSVRRAVRAAPRSIRSQLFALRRLLFQALSGR